MTRNSKPETAGKLYPVTRCKMNRTKTILSGQLNALCFSGAILLLATGCESFHEDTAAPVPSSSARPLTMPSEPRWEEVSQSNSLLEYARFFEKNPSSEHRAELEKLIAAFFIEKITKAEAEGKVVIRTAKQIKATVSGGTVALGPGSVLVLNGGGINMGIIQWLSDPTEPLVLEFGEGVINVPQGRGMALRGNEVYCFGLD